MLILNIFNKNLTYPQGYAYPHLRTTELEKRYIKS